MPIYEFTCSECGHAFEAIVPRPGAKAPCPECGSKKVKQGFSAPAAFSGRDSGESAPSCSSSG